MFSLFFVYVLFLLKISYNHTLYGKRDFMAHSTLCLYNLTLSQHWDFWESFYSDKNIYISVNYLLILPKFVTLERITHIKKC
uniref:Secreted protein n=1 Tax=Rhizophora mucronata TaxID=61149 RepID=A0A2P2MGG2_RHIMU